MAVINQIGIRAFGTALPDQEIGAAELAAMHGCAEEQMRAFLGGMRVYVAAESEIDLAVRAAQRCLERATVDPTDIDAIIFCNASRRSADSSSLRIQHEIGARNAFVFDIGQTCSELITGLVTARNFIATDSAIERILVVSGEKHDCFPLRMLKRYTGEGAPYVYSDAGAALLVENAAPLLMSGFGFAAHGRQWNHMERLWQVENGVACERIRANPNRDEKRASIEMTAVIELALERCLEDAGIDREAVTQVIMQNVTPLMRRGMAMLMGIPDSKILAEQGSPSHAGATDFVFGLEALSRRGASKEGDHLLLLGSSPGIARFAALRVTTTDARPSAR